MLRDYTGEHNLIIDGRNIPYQIFNAKSYLIVKHDYNDYEVEQFSANNPEFYQKLNQVIALKQACVLFRHTSHSCGSLSEDVYALKNELIEYIRDTYNYDFDEDLMENYPSDEEYNKLLNI